MKCGFDNVRMASDEDDLSELDAYRAELVDVVTDGEYASPESAINLPDDEELVTEVSSLVHQKGAALSHVIVVGIGGSSAGTRAVYEALGGYYDNFGDPRSPHMIFVETIDAHAMDRLAALVERTESPEELLVCVVSKSGRTVETVANADMLLDICTSRFGEEARSRFVAITEPDSPLAEAAHEQDMDVLHVPSVVSGRYSIFSAVGLFPLACAGVDIEALRAGARDMRDACLEGSENPAEHSARALMHYMRDGYRIHDTFLFDPVLADVGAWYRQLLAESIGKEHDRNGEQVRTGITPAVSLGSRDLHSAAQLVLGGPRERFTTFIRRSSAGQRTIPHDGIFSREAEQESGIADETLFAALAEGAERAYAEAGLPYIDVLLEEISEYELGALMQWKMLEVMYLARLCNVNAFDQPAVEAYKKAARDILSERNKET